jgi:very-short-patch-repair endonuclease
MTKAEACLWKYALKASMMKGYVFNRQRPVLNYIADFLSKKLLLIIEVDGYSHQNEESYRKDIVRQEKLESIGYKVIRFTDDEVLKNIKNVIRVIEITIEEREIELGIIPPPAHLNHTPSPFSFGEGARRADEVERGIHLQ